jgi:endonuclease/exonuclease/phosphatase family metal-dependent hydrolase
MRGDGTLDRWRRVAVAGCLALLLAGCAAPAGSDRPGPPPPPPPPPAAAAGPPPTPAAAAVASPPGPPVRVLQLNLCSSGIAGCYTGRSTAEAAAVVRAEAPDLVTVNEACEDDLAVLRDALAEVAPGDGATASFQAARDRRTGEGYRCRNGRQYGIGLVTRWPSTGGSEGIHPVQDPADPEERAWLCRDVAVRPALVVCTTHLAYTVRGVALAQCAHLSRTVVPELRARSGGAPAVLGADLNLGSDDPGLDSCLPPGHTRAGDGGPQHVVATPGLTVADRRTIDLRGSTDHPALLVTLERAGG